MEMKTKSLIACMLCLQSLMAKDTLHVIFSYGSVPKASGESKWFGGIHGGHVSVGYQGRFISFLPNGNVQVFKSKKKEGVFVLETEGNFVFDTTGSRYAIFSIPVDSGTIQQFDSISKSKLDSAGYDYAFFGMRCASAAYDLLNLSGVPEFPKIGRKRMVKNYFYPKKLRKKFFKLAKKKQWYVLYRPGRKTRKWERD
jgi:hypothetical protein